MLQKTVLNPLSVSILFILLLCGCSKKHNASIPLKNGETMIPDIVYGNNKDWQNDAQQLKMDLYTPAGEVPGKKYPLVVFMHGGGFLTGNKKSEYEKCRIMADSGFVVANVNYRLGWDKGDTPCEGNVEELEEAGYRGIQDVNTAIRFLVANADKYAVDTSWIFAGGSSAGATACLCMAYLNDTTIKNYYPQAAEKLGCLKTAGNKLTNSFSIKGICSIAGALPDSALINSSTAIPTIFFHGEKDKTVPLNCGPYASCSNYPIICGSACLYRALVRAQSPAIAHILAGADHGSGEGNVFSDEFKMRATTSFFLSITRKQPLPGGIYTGAEN